MKPDAFWEAPARGSQVDVDIFRLRPCISFAIVLYHCSVPASAPPGGNPLERRRRKDGLCCISTVEFNSSPELRRGVLLDACNYWMDGCKTTIDPYNSKKEHRSSRVGLAGTRCLSKKRKANQGFANQAFAWCHPEAGKTCNRRGCTKKRRELKK